MSNLIPTNIQVPTHLTNRIGALSPLAASLVGGLSSGNSFPRISIKGARFRIVEGSTETVLDSTSLNIIIVGANSKLSKTWYATQWAPDKEPQAPDCFSLDGVHPDLEATDPQNDLCATCPQNAWGSKVTPLGQHIKACADQKRLAVVAADDPSGPIYLMQVTPAALKGLNQYQKELAVRGISPEVVKTRVSFDTNASFPKLMFSFGGFIDADTQEIVDGLIGSDQVREVTGEKVPVAPVQVAARPAAEEPAPAPVQAAPKRGFGAAKAAEEPAPAPVQAAPKRGFGAAKEPAVSQEVSKPKAAAKPAPSQPSEAAASLADEIAALVGEVMVDDA